MPLPHAGQDAARGQDRLLPHPDTSLLCGFGAGLPSLGLFPFSPSDRTPHALKVPSGTDTISPAGLRPLPWAVRGSPLPAHPPSRTPGSAGLWLQQGHPSLLRDRLSVPPPAAALLFWLQNNVYPFTQHWHPPPPPSVLPALLPAPSVRALPAEIRRSSRATFMILIFRSPSPLFPLITFWALSGLLEGAYIFPVKFFFLIKTIIYDYFSFPLTVSLLISFLIYAASRLPCHPLGPGCVCVCAHLGWRVASGPRSGPSPPPPLLLPRPRASAQLCFMGDRGHRGGGLQQTPVRPAHVSPQSKGCWSPAPYQWYLGGSLRC